MTARGSKILIVEDDPDIMFVIQFILSEQSYDVFTSPDGKDLISQIDEVQPDLILMDIMLPNADGRQLCKEITMNNSFPIILMSANVHYLTQVSQACANDFIAKPFDLDDLIKRIELQLVA